MNFLFIVVAASVSLMSVTRHRASLSLHFLDRSVGIIGERVRSVVATKSQRSDRTYGVARSEKGAFAQRGRPPAAEALKALSPEETGHSVVEASSATF